MKMKRTMALLTAFMTFASCTVCHAAENFYDVSPTAWYSEYVNIASDFGIIIGRGDGTFDPNGTITCAEAVKMAACAHASMHNYEVSESDGENWYDKYLVCCEANNIIEPHVTFDMKKPATRAEIAYIFSRVDKNMRINEVPLTDIPDVDGNTPYYHEIMDMYEMGTATGDSNMAFHPYDNVTRAEAAAMIVRIIDYGFRIELPKG